MHLPRAWTRRSFAPVTAFHKAAEKPFSSTKQGRWGALHVRIAWRIYYQKQVKKMQHQPNSFHRDLTPEYPESSLPDKESEQPSCFQPHIDSPYKQPAFGNSSDRSEPGKTAGHSNHSNSRFPAECSTSSPAPHNSHTNKREKLGQPLELDEKVKHRGQQVKTDISPPRDTYLNQTGTPEPEHRHSGSLGRKRQLECVSSIKPKRVKKEIVDSQPDPSPFSTTHTSLHTMPEEHINANALSGMYPNSSKCNVTRTFGGLVVYPGSEMHPYQTASWDPIGDVHKRMDLYSRQNLLKDYSLNTCQAIRVDPVATRQKETFGDCSPPLYFPLALMHQQSLYLGSRHLNSHLYHPG
ncbi:uncharacterized protein LOC134880850 isoform X2 [Eleginops maclovinus]